jgi:dipeptidyl aminopeptidase/acylaminoacyl peptidase
MAESPGARLVGWSVAVTLLVVALITTVAGVLIDWPRQLPPVAFSAQTGYRQYDVWVASSGSVQALTDDQLSYAPAWSPDGRRIAFVRGEPDTWEECCGYGAERLWVMDADGSDARAVSDIVEGDDAPRSVLLWEPDGRSLLFIDGGGDLMRLDVEAGSLTTVLPRYGCDRMGCVGMFGLSPDGTRVVAGLDRQIMITDLRDGSEEIVADGVFGYGDNVTWSPDGEWLVMSALKLGDDEGIWAWNLEDERALQVSATQRATYTWTGSDELLTCRELDVDAEDGYGTDGWVRLLFRTDLGEGPTSHPVDEYMETELPVGDPEEPLRDAPGNCLADDMDGRVATSLAMGP